MEEKNIKILFLHGLDSSKDSTKFHAINTRNKFCIDIDYRNLTFDVVENLFKDMIETIQPHLLIGHSLGAYWALRMSYYYKLPAIIANPQLMPNFREDYPAICENLLNHDIPQIAYLEMSDELLDMHKVQHTLEKFMLVHTYNGGYHRLEHPEHLNTLIDYCKHHYLTIAS